MRYRYNLVTEVLKLRLICFAHNPGRNRLIPQTHMIRRRMYPLASSFRALEQHRCIEAKYPGEGGGSTSPEKGSFQQEPNTSACLVLCKQPPASSSSGNSGGWTSGSSSSMMTASATVRFFSLLAVMLTPWLGSHAPPPPRKTKKKPENVVRKPLNCKIVQTVWQIHCKRLLLLNFSPHIMSDVHRAAKIVAQSASDDLVIFKTDTMASSIRPFHLNLKAQVRSSATSTSRTGSSARA